MIKKTAFVLGVLWGIQVLARSSVDPEKLRTYGSSDSVMIYVFSSPSCPHCATYHAEILPALKEQLADKGLAQIKLVDTPGDKRSLAVSTVARCLDESDYHVFMEHFYDNQDKWAYGADGKEYLKKYLDQGNLSTQDWKACFNNDHLEKLIQKQRNQMIRQYRVTALPTTVVVKGLKNKAFVGSDPKIIPEIEKVVRP